MSIIIDEYFLVNLDRRKDRLEFISEEIKKSKLLSDRIKKWTAVDGREVNPGWIPYSLINKKSYEDIVSGKPVVSGLSMTPGALGFYLTHTKLFEYSVEHNKTIYVMDDDVDINPKFDQDIKEILQELPNSFDFCYLGYYDTVYEKIPFSKKLFVPKGQFCGPHGYVVSPKGAKKILELIYPIDIQLDSKLYMLQDKVEYYAAHEKLVRYIDNLYTDIQHETGCIKNYKKMEIIKNINYKEITNPIIVMALYDIGRDNWNSFGLSYDTYLNWMRNTLSLKSKFVIYTENKFSSKIKEYRKEFDPNLEDTIIIEKPIEELYYHKNYYKKLSDLMFSDSFKKKNFVEVPEMTEPLYNIIMFNKLEFLRDANEKRYFENDLLIWADAGGLRESIENYKETVWPCLEKINQLNNSKITFFSHSKNIHVNDEESHALSQVRYIQGTSFIVPSELINELAEKFETTVKECISQGYIGSDEKIFDITYCKDPDKYNLIKCTWRTYFKILKENSADLFDKNGNQSSKVFIDLGSYECSSVVQKIDELDIDRSWEVHAFEPNPLVDTQKYADKIKCCKVNVHKKAIWKRSGKVIFNQYGENGKSQGSLIEETGEGKSYGDYYASQIIESVDLLEFIRSFDDNKEIYISMDIEHAEFEIFEHMIKNGWPKNIKKIWVKWHSEKIQIPNSIKDVIEEIKK